MGQKLKLVLSDLHLGAGHHPQGCNPLEDFYAADEFVALLHEVIQESERDQREVELIFNGDLFEFLQVPAIERFDPATIYPKESYLDSSEAASIKRLKLIVQGHPLFFDALSDFMHVESPQRRITIIKGNHDVSLFWPGVKKCLREVLGATGTRASLLRFADEFVSREKIYIEHGHQHAEKMNGYHDSFNPRASDDPSQLFYPAGSHFVIDFFNQSERDRMFVDQIKPITALIWYALPYDFDFACLALAHFIRHLPSLVLSNFKFHELPFDSLDSLLYQLEEPQQRANLAEHYQKNPDFRRQFHKSIHRYLQDATLDNKGSVDFPAPTITDNALEMGLLNQQQQREMLRQAAEEITNQEKAQVIIFGHTHAPTQQQLTNGSLYINTGSWVKDFSQTTPETWQALFAGSTTIDNIPAQLSYARIDYDTEENPHAQLLHLTANSTNTGPDSSVSATASGFLERNMQRLFRFLSNKS